MRDQRTFVSLRAAATERGAPRVADSSVTASDRAARRQADGDAADPVLLHHHQAPHLANPAPARAPELP
jgi:hypothetical protein